MTSPIETCYAQVRGGSRPLLMVSEGNYLLHRADNVMNLTSPSGQPVGGVYGALNMFCADYAALKPKYVAISFDVPGVNFRHKVYPEYKLNNPAEEGKEKLWVQLLMLVRLFRLLGVVTLFLRGVESDDVVSSLAAQAEDVCGEPVNTVIVTADKDIQQCVGGRVRTLNTRDKWVGTVSSVQEKFKLPPSLIAPYLALVGDSNDGIPGVPNMGPVKARQILEDFEVADLMDNNVDLGKWSKMLTPTARSNFRRDLVLATTLRNVNVSKYGPYTLRPANRAQLKEALNSLGFRKLPSLVEAQLASGLTEKSSSLFSQFSREPSAQMLTDNSDWDGLMSGLWADEHPWEDAELEK